MPTAPSDTRSHWMQAWLREHGIGDRSELHKLTDKPGMVRELVSYAEEIVDESIDPLPEKSSQAIVVGKTLDLSGDLDCCYICLDEQLNRLVERSWPYFDQLVLRGLAPEKVMKYAQISEDVVTGLILAHAQILFRIEEVGLSPLLIFRPKPVACSMHYQEHAEEAGIVSIIPRSKEIVEGFISQGKVKTFEIYGDQVHYRFTHPDLPHYVENYFRPKRIPNSSDDAKVLPLVARDVFSVCSAHLVSDVSCARTLQAPLVTEVRVLREMLASGAEHGHLWSRRSASAKTVRTPRSVEEIVFDLEFPIIRGGNISDVLALREDQYESFERFRETIRQAVQERLNADPADSFDIAREIERDLIIPGLNEIEQKLHEAQRALGSKTSLSLSVGSVATTVGLLSHVPLLAGTGFAVVATAVQHAAKYFDDRREVKMHDLYFLWRATR